MTPIFFLKAKTRIDSLLSYQSQETDFHTHLTIQKIDSIKDCINISRAIDEESSSKSIVTVMLDFNSIEAYSKFFYEISLINLKFKRFNYVLVTLVFCLIHLIVSINEVKFLFKAFNELDLTHYTKCGLTIIGFSIVDYENKYTIDLLKEILSLEDSIEPKAIPVSN